MPNSGNPAGFASQEEKQKPKHHKKHQGKKGKGHKGKAKKKGATAMKARRCILWLAAVSAAALLVPASASAAFGFLPVAPKASVAQATQEGGAVATQAGSHPAAHRDSSSASTKTGQLSDGDLRDLRLELPPGLIENPTVLPRCSQADFHTPRVSPFETSLSGESCPDRTQVGTIAIQSSQGGGETRTFGLFNLDPAARGPLGARLQPLRRADRLHPPGAPGRRRIRADPASKELLPAASTSPACRLSIWGDALGGPAQRPARQLPKRGRARLRLVECSVGRPEDQPRRWPT